jgi:hypothetical protein
MTEDVLERVRRYAPTAASVAGEWTIVKDDEVVGRILAAPAGEVVPLHFVPARPPRRARWNRMLPVAASAAVLALAMGGLIALLPASGGDGAGGGRPTGPVFDPPPGLSTVPEAGAHQFVHQVTEQITLDPHGRPVSTSDFAMVMRDYLAPDGRIVSYRSGQQNGCDAFGPPQRPSFDEPTRAGFAAMPTGVAKLKRYLRSHVSGSSSRDEAVFVAVGDSLREGSLLASPRLRAAMVAVLSRTPGVTVHLNQLDYLGRASVRADFVDQRLSPGDVESLYFDATNFRLLEERSGRNGEPTRYAGPSPAHNGHGERGADPERLSYPASLTLVRSATVVDKAPAGCR